jgi:hypothetical protein
MAIARLSKDHTKLAQYTGKRLAIMAKQLHGAGLSWDLIIALLKITIEEVEKVRDSENQGRTGS